MSFLSSWVHLIVFVSFLFLGISSASQSQEPIHYDEEKHLHNVRQLTFGGNNAEAYWSPDGTQLVFQSDRKDWTKGCDQIFILKVDATADSTRKKMLSTGNGRTTCSFFMPNGKDILYASTHKENESCPPVPAKENGKYVWPIYSSYEIFTVNESGETVQLTQSKGYDAEATVSPKGDRIIFTSMRSGDLDLWTMKIDGTDLKQITSTLGYDGGANFSPDGTQIVWRASRPTTPEEIRNYRDLLSRDLVEPTQLEIYTANADGSNAKQITQLGNANWSPCYHPDGKHILFCSNYKSKIGFPFNIFMIDTEGKNLEQITYDNQFDSFPMFSPDGKRLVWCSNRHNGRTRDTNVFIADWK